MFLNTAQTPSSLLHWSMITHTHSNTMYGGTIHVTMYSRCIHMYSGSTHRDIACSCLCSCHYTPCILSLYITFLMYTPTIHHVYCHYTSSFWCILPLYIMVLMYATTIHYGFTSAWTDPMYAPSIHMYPPTIHCLFSIFIGVYSSI